MDGEGIRTTRRGPATVILHPSRRAPPRVAARRSVRGRSSCPLSSPFFILHPSAFILSWGWAVLALLTAWLVTTGCDSSEPGRQRRQLEHPVIHIVVVGEAKDGPTWAVLQATADRFDEQERFASAEVIAPATRSPRQQQELLKDLATRDVDAVCVEPTDAAAVHSVIDKLVQTGVPVVTIGRDVPGSTREAHCGPPEVEIGRAAAKACAAVVKKRRTKNVTAPKTVMLLHAGPDDPVYGARYRGFTQDLPLYEDVVLLRGINCGQNRSDAVRLVRMESRKYPRVGCWVFLEDWPLRALASSDRLLPPGCGIVLCNGSPRYFGRFLDGQIAAMITYDYRKVVERGLLAALRLAEERDTSIISSHYAAPVEIITSDGLLGYEERWSGWKRFPKEEG